jgi:hypothetical protein
MRVLALAVGVLALCGMGATPATSKGLTIGGFNMTRGGIESLQSEPALAAAITTAFPHSHFRYAAKLSKSLLAKVNVVIIGVAEASTTAITPLSAAEQKQLSAFVARGGTALIFTDNDLQFQTASQSLLTPFGLASTGVLDGNNTGSFLTLSSDPIQTGPFGTATQLDTSWPGWFSALGSSTKLATLNANGQPTLAYLPAGALAAGSGAVVFFSDSTYLIDSARTANDQIAVLNALALAPH